MVALSKAENREKQLKISGQSLLNNCRNSLGCWAGIISADAHAEEEQIAPAEERR